MFATLPQFFLDQWIWSITWGLQQTLVTIIALSLLVRVFLGYRLISSFFLATVSQLFALVALSALVYVILINLFEVTYTPLTEYRANYTVFEAAAVQGIIYTLLQLIFFKLFKVTFDVRESLVVCVIFTGNMMGALWAHWFLPPLL